MFKVIFLLSVLIVITLRQKSLCTSPPEIYPTIDFEDFIGRQVKKLTLLHKYFEELNEKDIGSEKISEVVNTMETTAKKYSKVIQDNLDNLGIQLEKQTDVSIKESMSDGINQISTINNEFKVKNYSSFESFTEYKVFYEGVLKNLLDEGRKLAPVIAKTGDKLHIDIGEPVLYVIFAVGDICRDVANIDLLTIL